MDNNNDTSTKLNTFDGVFLPSILTIFGVVMFLRLGTVISGLGIGGALLILAATESIAISTGLSISAISTNTAVSGGGAYFLISRALGPSFGGAIGICQYFSQTLSVPFYIIGFTESLVTIFPSLQPHQTLINLAALVIIFLFTIRNADLVMKIQRWLFIFLMLSILSFIIGALVNISPESSIANHWLPYAEAPHHSWSFYLAIFFPAVTGFLSGVNMSGDLRKPDQSLPRGTIGAILFGLAIYALQIVITGAVFPQEQLYHDPFNTLVNHAVFGTGFLVMLGVSIATITSAIGSMLGAPRILQAVAQDNIFPTLNFFSTNYKKTAIPLRATCLSFAISAVIFWLIADNSTFSTDDEFNPLNIMASTVAMFHVFTYAMINLAAFVETIGANPSFRPKFKFFSWHTSLFGFITSTAIAFLIEPIFAALSFAIMALLFYVSKKHAKNASFGDARRGFLLSRIRSYILAVKDLPMDAKNWRPQIAVLVMGNRHAKLLHFAELFNNNRSLISAISVLPNSDEQQEAQRNIEMICSQYPNVFPTCIHSDDSDTALNICLQTFSGLGALAPNTILCGLPHKPDRFTPFLIHLNTIMKSNFNCIIAVSEKTEIPENGTIDIWWRGRKNGSLMLILAYLMQNSAHSQKLRIRLLRMTKNDNYAESMEEMSKLLTIARIQARILLIDDEDNFDVALHKYSSEAAAIFIGFMPPQSNEDTNFITAKRELLTDLPATFLVFSNGEADTSK